MTNITSASTPYVRGARVRFTFTSKRGLRSRVPAGTTGTIVSVARDSADVRVQWDDITPSMWHHVARLELI